MSTRRQRLTTIAGLYVAQAIPLGFLIVALPAILRRRGLGLELTGLLGALALPWLLKFLWAPVVDRFGSARLGHYRSWIVPLQAVVVLTVLATAGLDLETGLWALVAAGAVFMLASATQDIATDGLAVLSIEARDRGRANGIQVGGYYLGQILGGGLMLVLYDRFGWAPALVTMALLLALPMIPLLGTREPARPTPVAGAGPARLDVGAIRRFATRPGAATWIAILLLFRAGEQMALMMVNPMLVDGGLSLEAVGLTLGVAGSIGALAGALAGGWSIEVVGRKAALVAFGGLQSVAILAYLVPAAGDLRPGTIYAVAATVAFAGGMATAALYTNMMDRCDPGSAGTDFTVQQSLCAIGPLVGVSLSGVLAARVGYAAHFVICAGLALATTILVARRLTAEDAAPEVREPVAETT